jgi:SynChlorMet cassette protein ScmD
MTDDNGIEVNNSSLIIAKTEIVLQEESDNWGILYNPENDFSFGINPVSVFIWNQLKKKHTIEELVNKVRENCTNVPGDVEEHVIQFIKQLLEKGLATLETA